MLTDNRPVLVERVRPPLHNTCHDKHPKTRECPENQQQHAKVSDAKSSPMVVGGQSQQQRKRNYRDGYDVASAPLTRQVLLSVTLESAQVIRFESVADCHVSGARVRLKTQSQQRVVGSNLMKTEILNASSCTSCK